MDGIVLLAKQPGYTSFSSLHNVKKALNTTKVGHTGTLDSFAQGLLVVCTGRLTRLAGNITEFDKEYKAVIAFGKETDTLEYTGQVIKETGLPAEQALISAVKAFTGPQQQVPPQFSALHVNGKRASDIARKGGDVSLPSRPIEVYKAEINELEKNSDGLVLNCMITFRVSKGTYIRSLARDIAKTCGSCGHLIGLYRTRVGDFRIEEAAGYSLLPAFTIEGCKKEVEKWQSQAEAIESQNKSSKKAYKISEADKQIQNEIPEKIKAFDEKTAVLCGFIPVHLTDEDVEACFRNGKPILKKWFIEQIDKLELDKSDDEVPGANCRLLAVFSQTKDFCGIIEKKDQKHFSYRFVIAFNR